ncbi:MAG: ABC transporter ATP-binding protein [Methanobacteriota archaeon]|nr:MAG: ABC transporter ATP-binding protein [Euryarchaeota archaeon]
MAAVEVRDLTKFFGSKPALRGVTLAVEEGEFFGLFGPNGAGKTTFLKILTGQLAPTKGDARVLGVDVVADPMAVKRAVGIVPEVESPPSYLTSFEYLYFVSRVRNLADPESRIARWLDFFDLEGVRHTICKDLSKGTRQKLMLAAAFLHEPKLLFLDEPFINLDPIYQRRVKDYLAEYVGDGRTVFMCSHLLDIAEKLCDRVGILSDGQLVALGATADVRGPERDLESAFLKLVGSRPR